MPDADDFDVEYFRNLLKGKSPQEGPAPLPGPALPAAGKRKPPAPKPVAPKRKGKTEGTRKRTRKP